ncbi:UvrD-helicase domain-containing protein [Pectobacterium brasiliense]|uniref:UvrD-helicase domain-containing protein n=1 Tax=Pectobacterium brasiliense TaxID=180957 RepID=UPI001968A5C9|nr:UvrD-helicase domain-containing protein [Pectobacterium brasiliense]MBN3246950.1 UvrD-helicase domain-containing protein [Pectobacterium brasiliense]
MSFDEDGELLVSERWVLAWLHFRSPISLSTKNHSISISYKKISYLKLCEVSVGNVWFLPKFLGCKKLILNVCLSGNDHESYEFVAKEGKIIELKNEINRFVNKNAEKCLSSVEKQLGKLSKDIFKLYIKEKYVRYSKAEELSNSNVSVFKQLESIWKKLSDYNLLSEENVSLHDSIGNKIKTIGPYILSDMFSLTRDNHNSNYISAIMHKEKNYFRTIEKSPLTEEQIKAALTFEDITLVTAAAGSGKSSCIVGKIGFAIKYNLFKENEILALAYNSEAAKELDARLKDRFSSILNKNVNITTKTFHAFGLSIIKKYHGNKYEILKEDGKEENRLIKLVINDLIDNDSEFSRFISEWIMFSPYDEPQPIGGVGDISECEKNYENCCRQRVKAKKNLNRNAFEATIPTYNPCVYVRSLEERAIANWLLLHGIHFEYEKPNWEGAKRLEIPIGKNKKQKPYKPDFTYKLTRQLSDGSVEEKCIIHEHFALDKNGNAPHWFSGTKYREYADNKRKTIKKWETETAESKKKILFIETTSAQYKDGILFSHLKVSLENSGFTINPPSEEYYKKSIADFRETSELENTIIDFVLKFKDSGLTKEAIEKDIDNHQNPFRFRSFLQVAFKVFDAYQEKLSSIGKIDFSDMIREATNLLNSNKVENKHLFILVDEFQDISKLRADLVAAILNKNRLESILFCVGDDWQTINRFAGSDVGIFTDVSKYFNRHTTTLPLTRTFRCVDSIAKVARNLVLRNKNQMKKEVIAPLDNLPNCIRIVMHENDADKRFSALEDELNKIVYTSKSLKIQNPSVKLLTRTKTEGSIPRGLENEDKLKSLIKKHVNVLKIEHETIHGSKGLEADFVIIIGLDSGFRGFPTERNSDPLFDLVLPKMENANEEERRLFYVGLTRAKQQVILLTNEEAPSEYILELMALEGEFKSIEIVNFRNKRVECPKCEIGSLIIYNGNEFTSSSCTRSEYCGYKKYTK